MEDDVTSRQGSAYLYVSFFPVCVLNQWCRACALLRSRHVTGIHPLSTNQKRGWIRPLAGVESTTGLLAPLALFLFLCHRMPSSHPTHTHTPRKARFLKRPSLVDVVRVMRARTVGRDRDGYIFFSRFPWENTSKIRKSDSIPAQGSISKFHSSPGYSVLPHLQVN